MKVQNLRIATDSKINLAGMEFIKDHYNSVNKTKEFSLTLDSGKLTVKV